MGLNTQIYHLYIWTSLLFLWLYKYWSRVTSAVIPHNYALKRGPQTNVIVLCMSVLVADLPNYPFSCYWFHTQYTDSTVDTRGGASLDVNTQRICELRTVACLLPCQPVTWKKKAFSLRKNTRKPRFKSTSSIQLCGVSHCEEYPFREKNTITFVRFVLCGTTLHLLPCLLFAVHFAFNNYMLFLFWHIYCKHECMSSG